MMGWDGGGGLGVYGFVFWLFVYGVRGPWARGGLVVVEYTVARAAREIKGFEGLKMEGWGCVAPICWVGEFGGGGSDFWYFDCIRFLLALLAWFKGFISRLCCLAALIDGAL